MRELAQDDVDRVARILLEQAAAAPAGPETYFRDLIARAALPTNFRMQLAGFGRGDPRAESLRLIRWAATHGVNPDDPRYTTLGSILRELLDDVGLHEARTLVAVIVAYDLYIDPELLSALAARYQVPVADAPPSAPDERSPDIDWRGAEDAVELQGLLRPAPDLLDVGYLSRALERSSSVCRIERPEGTALGTGFLVAADLVLTNYHVLAPEPGEDPAAAAPELALRFGYVSAPQGQEADGQVFRLHADGAVVQTSPVAELDYAMLRVEPAIRATADLRPVEPPANGALAKGMGLNILQHPKGGPMQLALSSNAVTGVYDDIQRVQYVTIAAGGSSGSPCFDDDWQLVALHHAERSRVFGAVREGIPFSAIHPRIEAHL